MAIISPCSMSTTPSNRVSSWSSPTCPHPSHSQWIIGSRAIVVSKLVCGQRTWNPPPPNAVGPSWVSKLELRYLLPIYYCIGWNKMTFTSWSHDWRSTNSSCSVYMWYGDVDIRITVVSVVSWNYVLQKFYSIMGILAWLAWLVGQGWGDITPDISAHLSAQCADNASISL